MVQRDRKDEKPLGVFRRTRRNNPSSLIPVRGGVSTKIMLCIAISKIVFERQLTQPEAARLLGINQPKVSALLNQKLGGFSVERLMHFLVALQQDVVIQVTPHFRKPDRALNESSAHDKDELREPVARRIPPHSVTSTKHDIAAL